MSADFNARRQKLITERRFRVYRFAPQILFLFMVDRVITAKHRPGHKAIPPDTVLLTAFFLPPNNLMVLIVLHEDFAPQPVGVEDWGECESPKIDVEIYDGAILPDGTKFGTAASSQSPEPPAHGAAAGQDEPPEDPYGLFGELPYKDG